MTGHMDRRALPGLVAGLAGCAFGVVGAAMRSPVLTILAASSALAASIFSLVMLDRVRGAEQRANRAAEELADMHTHAASFPSLSRSVVDPATGLPDARFFEVGLASRVAAARRHLWPVTVVMLELSPAGDSRRAEAVTAFSAIIRQTLREADVVCRIGPSTFALLLEDTNEAGGVWAAERLQSALAAEQLPAVGLAAGVATYPTHGLDAHEIVTRARRALARACTGGPGWSQVEVASADA